MTSRPHSFIRSLSLAAFCTAGAPALAVDATPFFTVYGGLGSWSTELSGNLGETNTDIDQLGFDDESNGYFYVGFEHAVPVLPNIRLERISLDTSGSGILTESYTIGDETFEADTRVDSALELEFTDAVLYYEIAIFDLGLTLRQFDAVAVAEGEDPTTMEPVTEREEVDGVIPMLYAQTKVELPLTGLYVTGSGSGISVSDISVMDLRGAIGYQFDIGPVAELGFELGLRSFSVDLGDEEDFRGDFDFEGAYFGAHLKF